MVCQFVQPNLAELLKLSLNLIVEGKKGELLTFSLSNFITFYQNIVVESYTTLNSEINPQTILEGLDSKIEIQA